MADTIAAISTGLSVSAIGIIRMSGDDAILIADRAFRGRIPLTKAEDRKLYYGELLDSEGNTLDFCLCTISRAPHSYTGENTVEFQCHGSPTVLAEGLNSLFKLGARQALAGEFTKRAFLNGCMDLTQAEAVIDLIDAETVDVARNAAGQLAGAISHKTDAVYNDLLDIMSHFHAVIDYPDEDIDDFQLGGYIETLNKAENTLQTLLATFDRGKIMKEGVKSAIIGKPNAGKSSLLNALLGYDRAIVTDIAGTTRDVIEEKVKLKSVVLRLADTAGIRDTDDVVESIGVERARSAAENAQLIIAVIDGSLPLDEMDRQVLEAASNAPNAIAVINKSDLGIIANIDLPIETVTVSAINGEGISKLTDRIEKMFADNAKAPAGEILTNSRQADAVFRALEAIKQLIAAMNSGTTPDAVLTEAEEALNCLGELTGKTVREDITHRIFSRFCVGK